MCATPSLISKANAVNSIEPVLGWFRSAPSPPVLAFDAPARLGFLSRPWHSPSGQNSSGASAPPNSYTTLSYPYEARPELCCPIGGEQSRSRILQRRRSITEFAASWVRLQRRCTGVLNEYPSGRRPRAGTIARRVRIERFSALATTTRLAPPPRQTWPDLASRAIAGSFLQPRTTALRRQN